MSISLLLGVKGGDVDLYKGRIAGTMVCDHDDWVSGSRWEDGYRR